MNLSISPTSPAREEKSPAKEKEENSQVKGRTPNSPPLNAQLAQDAQLA